MLNDFSTAAWHCLVTSVQQHGTASLRLYSSMALLSDVVTAAWHCFLTSEQQRGYCLVTSVQQHGTA